MMLKAKTPLTSSLQNTQSESSSLWRFLLRCVLGAIVVYVFLWVWASQYAPSEGHVFERLPPISGLHQFQVGEGRNRGKSLILNQTVYCGGISFFDAVGQACLFNASLYKDSPVTVIQTLIPTYLGSQPVVTSLFDSTKKYIDLDDATVRAKWLSNTQLLCILFSLPLSFILTTCLRLQRIKRAQKAML
jgi:hypothetical protein